MSDVSSLTITSSTSDAVQSLRALESQLKKTLDMASKLNASLSSIGLNKNLTANLKIDTASSPVSNTAAVNEAANLNKVSDDLSKSLKSNRKDLMGMKNNIMLLNTSLLGSSNTSKVFSSALGVLIGAQGLATLATESLSTANLKLALTTATEAVSSLATSLVASLSVSAGTAMASITALGASLAALAAPLLAIVGVIGIFVASLAAVVLAIQSLVVFLKNMITGGFSKPTEDEYWIEQIMEKFKSGLAGILGEFGIGDGLTAKEREQAQIAQAELDKMAAKLTEELNIESRFVTLRRNLRLAEYKKDYDAQVQWLRKQRQFTTDHLNNLVKEYNEGQKKLTGGGLTEQEFKTLQSELKNKLQQIERLDQQRLDVAAKENQIWATIYNKEVEFLEKRAKLQERLQNFSNSFNYGYLEQNTPWGKKGQFGNWTNQAAMANSSKSLEELQKRIEALEPPSIVASEKTAELMQKIEGNNKAMEIQEKWYEEQKAAFAAGKMSQKDFDESTKDYEETQKILKEVHESLVKDLIKADADYIKQSPEFLANLKKYAELQEENFQKTKDDYSLQLKAMEAQRQKLIQQQNAFSDLTKLRSQYRQAAVDAVESRSIEALKLQSRELSSSESFVAPMVEQQKEIKKVEMDMMELQKEGKKELEKITEELKKVNQRITIAEGGRVDRIELIEPKF